MKDYNAAEVKAGIFFLSMIVVLIVAIGAVTGLGESLTTSFKRYEVTTTNAFRLADEAPVTFSGYPAGYVSNVRLDGNLVRFDLFVNAAIPIPQKSVATFRTDGLLGEQYIDIEPGKGPGTIDDGGAIPVELGASFQDVTNKANQLVSQVNDIVGELRVTLLDPKLMEGVRRLPQDLDLVLTDVRTVAGEARTTMEEARPRVIKLLDNLNKTVEQLDATVARASKPLEEAAGSIRDTSDSTRKLIEDDATGAIKDARRAIAEVRVQVVALIDDVGKIVATLEKQTEGTVTKADSVLTNADEFLVGANTFIADTNRIVNENERNAYIALVRLKRTLANLEVFSEKIAREPSALVFGSEDDDADDEEARAERGVDIPFDPDRVGPLGPVKRD